MQFEKASQNPAKKALTALWELFVSPTAFVVLSILWCLDLAIGSLLAYEKNPRFWMQMDSVPFNYWLKVIAPQEYPTSIWVYILVALTYLMVASLLFCTLNWFLKKRRRYRGMGEVLVHFGFLLVFAGYVLGSGWGARVQDLSLAPGGQREIESLGLRLKVESTEIKTDQMGNDLDTVSKVILTDLAGNEIKAGTISINHPLIAGSTVVYPNGNIEDSSLQVEVEGQGVFALSGESRVQMPDGRGLEIRGFL
ncbi:cytochrome c biogenesis protein ResB, partial [bacterium]